MSTSTVPNVPPEVLEAFRARRRLAVACFAVGACFALAGAGLFVAAVVRDLSWAWIVGASTSLLATVACAMLAFFFAANALDAIRPRPWEDDGSDSDENPCTHQV